MGGRVEAKEIAFDIRTLTLSNKTYHGVYGEDFLTFGEFHNDVDPEHEETLLKIFEEGAEEVLDRHHFKFVGQQVTYSRSVNGNQKDTDVDHEITETPLAGHISDTWSESFFYGVGNDKM